MVKGTIYSVVVYTLTSMPQVLFWWKAGGISNIKKMLTTNSRFFRIFALFDIGKKDNPTIYFQCIYLKEEKGINI